MSPRECGQGLDDQTGHSLVCSPVHPRATFRPPSHCGLTAVAPNQCPLILVPPSHYLSTLWGQQLVSRDPSPFITLSFDLCAQPPVSPDPCAYSDKDCVCEKPGKLQTVGYVFAMILPRVLALLRLYQGKVLTDSLLASYWLSSQAQCTGAPRLRLLQAERWIHGRDQCP